MRLRTIQVIISGVALIAIVVHLWVPKIKIDLITVVLLGFSMLPWLGPLFKSVEMPGGLKVEFQDLEKAQKKVEESGLIPSEKNLRPMQKHIYSFQAVVGNDPSNVLSGLESEIEHRLLDLASKHKVIVRGHKINELTGSLEKSGVLSHEEADAIYELMVLLNQVENDAKVESSAFGWAMDFGPKVLGALEDRLGETTIPQLIEAWKRRDGSAFQEVGTELYKIFCTVTECFLVFNE